MHSGKLGFIRGLFLDKLFKSTFWLIVGAVFTGVSNYGLQVILARHLSNGDYVFYNVLFSVFVVVGVPITTLLMVVSRKTTEFRTAKDPSLLAAFFYHTFKKILVIGLLGLAAYSLCSKLIGNFLNAPSLLPIFVLGLLIFVSFMLPVPMAFLQGLQESSWFAFFQGFNGPIRFFFCLGAVFIGCRVNGVMNAVLLSHIVLWVWSIGVVKRYIGAPSNIELKNVSLAWKEFLPVLIANFSFALLTQMDLVLVNRFFNTEDAAIYASAAVLGRSVIYVPAALVLAMFPMVSEIKAQNLDTKPLLYKALAWTILISGFGALIFYLFPKEVINILYGGRYISSSQILKFYGVTMLPVALLMVLMNYFIAHGNSSFGIIMLVMSLIEVSLIWFFHPSLMSVIFILGMIGIALFFIGLMLLWAHHSPVKNKSFEANPSLVS